MKYTLSRFAVKQEKIKEAKRALSELADEVHRHEPRTFYMVFREESQNVFFTLVSFENEAAWRRHAQSRYVHRFARKLLPICEGKPAFFEVNSVAWSRKHWVLNGAN
jgi:quinol monooxygenase YgiN